MQSIFSFYLPEPGTLNLELLHLCDSLFPIGGFAYSDGLERATSDGTIADAAGLQAWLEAVLDDTIGRLEGPAVWHAWRAVADGTGACRATHAVQP